MYKWLRYRFDDYNCLYALLVVLLEHLQEYLVDALCVVLLVLHIVDKCNSCRYSYCFLLVDGENIPALLSEYSVDVQLAKEAILNFDSTTDEDNVIYASYLLGAHDGIHSAFKLRK